MARVSMLLLAVVFTTGLSSCGDDEKPANKITVDGTTVKLAKGYIGSASNGEESEHIVILTSEGVSMNDEGEISGTGGIVFFYLASEEPTLVKGTYELDPTPDYGDLIFLQIAEIEDGNEPESFYYAAEGSVKVVSAKADKFTFKFNFSEVFLSTEEEDVEIDATIKGYFSGKVETFDASDEGPARLSAKLKALRMKK